MTKSVKGWNSYIKDFSERAVSNYTPLIQTMSQREETCKKKLVQKTLVLKSPQAT